MKSARCGGAVAPTMKSPPLLTLGLARNFRDLAEVPPTTNAVGPAAPIEAAGFSIEVRSVGTHCVHAQQRSAGPTTRWTDDKMFVIDCDQGSQAPSTPTESMFSGAGDGHRGH